MKYFTFALLVVYVLCSCTHNNKDDNKKWVLVWEENFDGGSVDTTVWSKIPRGLSDWNKYMSDHDSLYAVENGNLILRGMPNTLLPNDTAPFITGGIYTKDKKIFGLGRLEIRAKLYGAQGAWPALWMLPEGPYPEGGEIDIMEWYDRIDSVSQCVHSYYTLTLGIKTPLQGAYNKNFEPSDYNVYTVERHLDSVVFYVNDSRTITYPRIETNEKGQFPFADFEYYLLIDMQHSHAWKGKTDPKELPFKMEVDWIRFYESSY